MVTEVKESSDFWTIFDLFYGHYWTFWTIFNKLCIYGQSLVISGQNSAYFKDIVDNFKWVLSFFFKEGRYLGYRHTQRNTLIHSWWKERIQPCGKGKDIGTSGTLIHIPYGKRERVRASRDPTRRAGKTRWASRDPQVRDTQIIRRAARPSQGQAENPTRRAPTRTSRRAGIGQGDLLHTKATTSS